MPAEAACRLTLEGRVSLPWVERVHDLLDELWVQVPDVEPGDRYAFETAVIEIAGNIAEHGGPGVDLRLSLDVHADRLEAQFLDTGPAVDLPAAPRPVPDVLAEQGRGMALALAAVDEIRYERAGRANRWRMRKWRSGRGR